MSLYLFIKYNELTQGSIEMKPYLLTLALTLPILVWAEPQSLDESAATPFTYKYVRVFKHMKINEDPFEGYFEFYEIKDDQRTKVGKVLVNSDGEWTQFQCFDDTNDSIILTYEQVYEKDRKLLTDNKKIKCADFFTTLQSRTEYEFLSVNCLNPPVTESAICVESWANHLEESGCKFSDKKLGSGSSCTQKSDKEGKMRKTFWFCHLTSYNCVSQGQPGNTCPQNYSRVELDSKKEFKNPAPEHQVPTNGAGVCKKDIKQATPTQSKLEKPPSSAEKAK